MRRSTPEGERLPSKRPPRRGSTPRPGVDTGAMREAAADRLEQEVGVRADAAAEDHEPEVGHGGDRRDVQRDAPRLLRHDRAGYRVAARGPPRRRHGAS